MYIMINEYEFRDLFKKCGRDNFSYEGYEALFNYLDEICSSDEKGFQFDAVSIDCEFTEYESLKEFQGDYGKEYKSIEDIQEMTSVILIDNSDSFIIEKF